MARTPVLTLLLAAALCAALGPRTAAASEALEYKVKAAFVFNFARFTTWPPERFAGADTPIEICVLADREFEAAMTESVAGKTLGTRPLTVRNVARTEDTPGCHVLYAGGDAGGILAAAAGRGVLTIHDEAAARRDGVVRFFVEDRRVRFEVNAAAAARENLQLSSKLLSLASMVSL